MAALARLLAKHKDQQLIARKEQLRNLLRLQINMKKIKGKRLAVPKVPTVRQRIATIDRIDAVRRLQNIGEQRRAQILHQGLRDEHERLSGEFHRLGDVSGLKGKIHNWKKLMEEAESRMEHQGVANLLRRRQPTTAHQGTSEYMARMHSAAPSVIT